MKSLLLSTLCFLLLSNTYSYGSNEASKKSGWSFPVATTVVWALGFKKAPAISNQIPQSISQEWLDEQDNELMASAETLRKKTPTVENSSVNNCNSSSSTIADTNHSIKFSQSLLAALNNPSKVAQSQSSDSIALNKEQIKFLLTTTSQEVEKILSLHEHNIRDCDVKLIEYLRKKSNNSNSSTPPNSPRNLTIQIQKPKYQIKPKNINRNSNSSSLSSSRNSSPNPQGIFTIDATIIAMAARASKFTKNKSRTLADINNLDEISDAQPLLGAQKLQRSQSSNSVGSTESSNSTESNDSGFGDNEAKESSSFYSWCCCPCIGKTLQSKVNNSTHEDESSSPMLEIQKMHRSLDKKKVE